MDLFYTLLLLCLQAGTAERQAPSSNYPQDYFVSPVEIDLYLSGTFGEIRSSHFHSGIDIKTLQRVGVPVHAAAAGYVSRINISPTGFGKAIYIAHPNGYTTVYAHLDRFSDEIQQYVKREQYKAKRFAVELYPGPGEFPLGQGDLIASSGNSGGSGGPHLHFEIRDKATQKPVDPMLFGLPILDRIPPTISGLAVYSWNGQGPTPKGEILETRLTTAGYRILRDTVFVDGDLFGAALQVHDQLDGAGNRNGIYSIELAVDGTPVHHFELSSFAFRETRYVVGHIDFGLRAQTGRTFQRCFRLPGNRFSGYKLNRNDGWIDVSDGKPKRVHIRSLDHVGNPSEIRCVVRKRGAAESASVPADPKGVRFLFDRYNSFDNDLVRVEMPKDVLMDDIDFTFGQSEVPALDIPSFSPLYSIHTTDVAAFRYFQLHLLPEKSSALQRKKALIVQLLDDGSWEAEGGNWEEDMLRARVREFGDYFISQDVTAPTVRPLNWKKGQDLSAVETLDFYVDDDLSGVARYEGEVDGTWVLFEHDPKNRHILHRFDERVGPGLHRLVFRVWDEVGNITTYQAEFKR